MTSLILRTATRFLLSLMLLFSLFLLLSGHNEPGGGFAGGLVLAAAWALYAIAYGAAAQRVLQVEPQVLIGLGLVVALSSGILALVLGQPFMTGQWLSATVPGLGKVAVGTPVLFDVGVYVLVLGVVVLIILSLAEA